MLQLLLIVLFYTFQSQAQTYPVQVIPQVTSPPPVYLSEYTNTTNSTDRIKAQLLLTDLTVLNREVRLKLYIEGNSIQVQSKDFVIGAPQLFLDGGIPLQLASIDLAPYFEFQNLQGISAGAYANELPEGLFQFCFEVYDVLSGNVISNKSCTNVLLFLNDPPFLNLPTDHINLEANNPQNILFQWTPRHINVTNVEYEFSLVEIWDTTMDPQAVFLASPPIYQTTTRNTTLLYGLAEPQLLEGKRYAWRVQAKAISGVDEIGLFKNKGYSEIFTFTYQGNCAAPTVLRVEEVTSKTATFHWQGTIEHTEFKIAYRKAADVNGNSGNANSNHWFDDITDREEFVVIDLEPNTTYEYRVGGYCMDGTLTYTTPLTFTTMEADTEAYYNCGIAPNINISNTIELEKLQNGDVIKAGDFKVKIQETSGAGSFTGKGYTTVGFLKNIKIALVFTDIKVNTDYQLLSGTIKTVYDPTWSNILDVDTVIDEAEDIVDVFTGDDHTDLDVDYEIASEDAIVVTNNQIVITDTNGDTHTYDYDTGDTYTISSNGNEYSIDTNGNVTQTGVAADGGRATAANTSGISDHGSHNTQNPSVNTIEKSGVRITFGTYNTTKYGLDKADNTYEKEKYKKVSIEGGDSYYPIHKAVADGDTDIFYADILNNNKATVNTDALIFKTVSGKKIDAEKDGKNRYKITVKGTNFYHNEEAIITYKDKKGKQHVLSSFFIHHIKKHPNINVQVVLVNGATDIPNLKDKLNTIYNPAGVPIVVGKTQTITIPQSEWDTEISNGKIDYNGSGLDSDYPKELNAIKRYFKAQNPNYNSKAYYLFVLDKSITATKALSGFMPKTRQWGFIFQAHTTGLENKPDEATTIAHELGHGVFALGHPFGKNPENAPVADTWLMDYANGTELAYPNWATMSDKGLKLYLFQDDQESELIQKIVTIYLSIDNRHWNDYAFLSPVGTTILLDNASHVKFNEDGGVMAFKQGGETFLGVYSPNYQKFLGYINSKYDFVKKNHIITGDFITEFNQKKYTNINFAPIGKTVVAIARKRYSDNYQNCIIKATWGNIKKSNSYTGIASPPFIPSEALIVPDKKLSIAKYKANYCSDPEKDGVIDGKGTDIYNVLINEVSDAEKPELIIFANYMSELLKNKTFVFYGHGLENYWTLNTISSKVLKYLRDNKIYSLEKFISNNHFPINTFSRDAQIIFSNVDLREGIADSYNSKSTDWVEWGKNGEKVKYEYSFSDLEIRTKHINNQSALSVAIHQMEESGLAEPICMKDGYDQYVAQFGTNSAIFSWAKFAANSSKNVLNAYFLQRLIAAHGVAVIEAMGADAFKRFTKGALIELSGFLIANRIFGKEVNQEDINNLILDMALEGIKEVFVPDSRLIQSGFDCINGMDIATMNGLIHVKNFEDLKTKSANASIECFVPVALGLMGPAIKKLITPNGIFNRARYSLFKNKNKFYKKTIKDVLTSKNGEKAIDLLIKSGFDASKLSARNIKRLANIIAKHGESDALVNLFKGTTDVNRMLIFLDKIVDSPQQYKKVIDKITNSNLFKKTITIDGKTQKISTFFNSMSDAYEYYHKVDGNKHFFAKIENKEGILLIIDFSVDIILETIEDKSKQFIKDKLGLNKVKTKDEE